MRSGIEFIVIPKQEVEFSDPPPARTEEAHIEEQKEMAKFIREKGFRADTGDPGERFLVVERGLAIGVFRSLPEMHDYVRKGYPADDIERYKVRMTANGYPEDFHRLPGPIRQIWDQLPDEAKRDIREKGVGAITIKEIGETRCGKRIISPGTELEREPVKRKKTKKDEKHLRYIGSLGFEIGILGDDGRLCLEVDSDNIIGPFPSLESVYEYLRQERHLADIQYLRDVDKPTVH